VSARICAEDTLRVFTKTKENKENKENRKKQFDYNTGKKNNCFLMSFMFFKSPLADEFSRVRELQTKREAADFSSATTLLSLRISQY